MKVKAHSPLEPLQKYNQDQTTLMNLGFTITFLMSWELLKYYPASH